MVELANEESRWNTKQYRKGWARLVLRRPCVLLTLSTLTTTISPLGKECSMETQTVLVIPLGDYDPDEGVTAFLGLRKANKAYLVFKNQEVEQSHRFLKEKLLTSYKIEVNPMYVNNDDLVSCLEKYREIFNAEQGNDIFVNLSTGNNMTALAGMMACMLGKGFPYYVRLERKVLKTYVEERWPQIIHLISGTDFLPAFEIAKPSAHSMMVLSIINEEGGHISKKTLIEKLQSPGHRLIPQYTRSVTKSAPHSRLRPILDPLEKRWRFVTIEARGRRSQVSLTPKGRAALRIFSGWKAYR